MKTMTLKKISAGIAAMLLLSQAVFAAAQENNMVYYENYFDSQTEMDNVFSGEGSTFSVDNGMGKIVTKNQTVQQDRCLQPLIRINRCTRCRRVKLTHLR